MKWLKLLYVLASIKLLNPLSLWKLAAAVRSSGINLMALLQFAKRTYPDRTAVVDDQETLTYKELYLQSMNMASSLHQHTQIQSGDQVGLLCRNHTALIKSIFAVSRLGADIYLLNADMSKDQLKQLLKSHSFKLVIYDEECSEKIRQSGYKGELLLSDHKHRPSVQSLTLPMSYETVRLKPASTSKLLLLTGGTTGASKKAAHTPSLFHYLNPFAAFIKRLNMLKWKTVYIATPISHGYGIAVLLLLLPLGHKAVITRSFEAEHACRLIREHQVDMCSVVPLMLDRMLQSDARALTSLKCIASGGAKLHASLAQRTERALGGVLYNLYGTSESGLNFIATPKDLKHSPDTIGMPIHGMHVRLLDQDNNEMTTIGGIGELQIGNDWSMSTKEDSYIHTGDHAYRDTHGYYYLAGRTDDMIVSAGVNVYPIELEQVLTKHTAIADAAVVGIADEAFGERLKAFIEPAAEGAINEKQLREWLKPRVARHQMPKEILIVAELPYTPVGKLDKKQLRSW